MTLNKMSQELLDGLSGHLVCTFMSPSRLFVTKLVVFLHFIFFPIW